MDVFATVACAGAWDSGVESSELIHAKILFQSLRQQSENAM
jgi:hypothetical protein